MRSIKEIAWLAGILEGEASFQAAKSGGHKTSKTPTIDVQMTDKDIIDRVANIFQAKPRSPWQSKLGNHQLVHSVAVCGTRAISWMMTLYSLMGQRRREKIKEIIRQWKELPYMPRAPRGERFMAICHPDRVRAAHVFVRPAICANGERKRDETAHIIETGGKNMKVLGEGFYFFREPTGQVRIWHDCKQYKDRDSARVEMKEMKNGTYVCPHCELQYKLTDIDRARIG